MAWPVPGALAFVSPRYGTEVLGGAETVVREMATRLAARGLPVEVLSTCAVDHFTWADHYPEGESVEDGVRVRRFRIQRGSGEYRERLHPRIAAGLETSYEEQERWINDGFRSAGLFHHLMQHHPAYHTVLLTPYMFWTTYACAQVAPHKNVLRPCLHDEPEARLDIFRPVFRDARGVTFNSPPEAALAERLLELPRRREVVGEGVEPPREHDAARFRAKFGIEGPFVVYAGRREAGKNFPALLDHFERFLARTGREVDLVLLGRGETPVHDALRRRVRDLGFVSAQDYHDAFAAAVALCQPSLRESFSRVLMEAWLASTPAIVDAAGAVTRYHAERSGGGLAVHDAFEFEVALLALLERPALRARMGQAGRAYVLAEHTWDRVLERFVDRIGAWALEDPAVRA